MVVQLPRRVREVRTGSYRFVQCRKRIACGRLWDGEKMIFEVVHAWGEALQQVKAGSCRAESGCAIAAAAD